MAIPVLLSTASAPEHTEVDVLVLGVAQGDGVAVLALPAGTTAASVGLAGLDLAAIGMTGAAGELVRLPGSGIAAGSIALAGLGATPVDTDALRTAAGGVTRRLRGVEHVGIAFAGTGDEQAGAVLEGAGLGAYTYPYYRREEPAAKRPVTRVTLIAAVADDVARRAAVAVEAVALVKDLVHAPPLDLFPATLADRAAAEGSAAGLEVRVWDEEALAEDGFGGILGVGQGSSRPPRLVRLEWRPGTGSAHIALVGKGITFDSGGLSLKPPGSMVGMKADMAGAATVLAVVVAAARLALPVRVTGWLCIAENMPSGTAIRPNDVLRIRGGTTVEVLNTDAEGRLVLADGLMAASEEHPDAIVDVATLTGAATGALGTRTVGVMGDADLVGRVRTAAGRAGESAWHMPLPDELRALLNSEVADLANTKPGNTAGGMLVAAHFLREFVGTTGEGGERIPWAHLDIAGTATNSGSPHGFTGTGATGSMVRTLLALLEDEASADPSGPAVGDG